MRQQRECLVVQQAPRACSPHVLEILHWGPESQPAALLRQNGSPARSAWNVTLLLVPSLLVSLCPCSQSVIPVTSSHSLPKSASSRLQAHSGMACTQQLYQWCFSEYERACRAICQAFCLRDRDRTCPFCQIARRSLSHLVPSSHCSPASRLTRHQDCYWNCWSAGQTGPLLFVAAGH